MKNLTLILDLNKLSIKDLSYIKICCPIIYRDDIPPINRWFKLDFDKITDEEFKIVLYDFPELYSNVNIFNVFLYLFRKNFIFPHIHKNHNY